MRAMIFKVANFQINIREDVHKMETLVCVAVINTFIGVIINLIINHGWLPLIFRVKYLNMRFVKIKFPFWGKRKIEYGQSIFNLCKNKPNLTNKNAIKI